MKKILFIAVILVSIILAYFIAEKVNIIDEISFQQKDFEVGSRNIEVLKKEVNLNFETNGFMRSIDRNGFEIILFISGLRDRISPHYDDVKYYGFVQEISNSNNNPYELDLTSYKLEEFYKRMNYSLILDFSGSMFQNNDSNSPIYFLKNATVSFIEKFNNNDFAEIIKFGSSIKEKQSFTNDKELLKNAIFEDSNDMGGTALYDAINLSLNNLSMTGEGVFNSIIAFTDGEDNESSSDIGSILNLAMNYHTPIFTVAFNNSNFDESGLKKLSNESGGLSYFTNNVNGIDSLYSSINNNIYNSVVLKGNFKNLKDKIDFRKYKLVIKGIYYNQIISSWETSLYTL